MTTAILGSSKVVQLGENHTWLVTGSSLAVILAVMTGSY
jgi:hypothetical protein